METVIKYWTMGGPLMVPLALLSAATWFWMIELHIRLKGALAGSSHLDEILGCLGGESSDLDLATELLHGSSSSVGRVMEHVLGGDMTQETIRSRSKEAIIAETSPMEREIGVLKGMVATAPLLGLLGTVVGMIATFSALAARGTASADALSQGISQALITTQVGLVVVLPGIFGAHALGQKLLELTVTLERAVAHLLTSASNGYAS